MQAVKLEYNYDEQANKIGLITGISEEIYFCSISRVSTVYVEYTDNNWMTYRETYNLNKNKTISHRVIARGNFELVLARTKQYLNYIKKNSIERTNIN